jgi:hypothetical protein
MTSPTSRFIPSDTFMSEDLITNLRDNLLPLKKKDLASLKMGDVESSLWLMEQIEHLTKLLRFNEENTPPEGAEIWTREKANELIGII